MQKWRERFTNKDTFVRYKREFRRREFTRKQDVEHARYAHTTEQARRRREDHQHGSAAHARRYRYAAGDEAKAAMRWHGSNTRDCALLKCVQRIAVPMAR